MDYKPNELFQAAASLAALGMKVVKLYGIRDDGSCTCSKGHDCPSKGKHPAGDAGWQHRATDNEDDISTWFEGCNENVRWNIGVRLGRVSGIVDIEADDEQAMEVIRRYGLDQIDTTAFRGSRGPHYLFQYDPDLPDVGVTKVDGLECRLGGGEAASQSVFPKSWHKTKVQYDWLPGRSPDEVRPAPLPEAFKQAILANSKGKGTGTVAKAKDAILADHKVGEGGRHAFLVGIASWLAGQCRDYSDADRTRVNTVLRALNVTHCDPPKTVDEVRKVANDQFDHYRNRHLERRANRPFERHGLEWDAEAREWEPGGWQLIVVHSDPTMYRLVIPNRTPGEPSHKILMDTRTYLGAREVAIAVLAATKRINLLDPNPSRWAAVWNGENVENEAGERRQIRGLASKLIDVAEDEYPPPELKRFSYVATTLLDYLKRFEVASSEAEEDNVPNASGVPKWIRVRAKDSDTIRDELWFKWNTIWDQIRSKNASISAKDRDDIHTRVLAETGEERFRQGHRIIAGSDERFRVWTKSHIKALERIAEGGG